MAEPAEMVVNRVRAPRARYIKLGRGGRWERLCLEDGTMRFGYGKVPHDLALSGDREQLRQCHLDLGYEAGTATSHANQILSFYHDKADTLWITISGGYLWWCFAHTDVEYLGTGEEDERGARLRHTVDGWHNTSIGGHPLRVADLNGGLTRVAAYRATVCNVEMLDYLVRKINDEDLPEVRAAHAAKRAMVEAIDGLTRMLPWREFEILVELIYAQSGWRRIGATGGTQKTVDIELELPSTGERAFIQVKSRTDQAQLDDYVERLSHRGESRMFYVYHSGPETLAAIDPRVVLIGPDRLPEMVLNAGLFDWLLEKVG